jgi:Ser/Thr protein kinase RdoA (MazF antagonist)
MLKLKHLFDNRDLAMMLLENWGYDKNALDMLDYFRISGNAIYPYKCNGEICFLRFVPWEAKIENEMNEEINFIQYLLQNGLNVLEPIISKQGNCLLNKNTPWGKYLVCAFRRVEGDRLDGFNSDGIDWTDELISGYGKELGKIHKFSSKYKNVPKKSCFKIIEEMDFFIKTKMGNNEIITKELKEIKNLLKKIPQNKSNFGLIHGDYELDNVFYDKNTKKYSIIDFGSSIYH